MPTVLIYEFETLETLIRSLVFPSEYTQPTLFGYDDNLKAKFLQEVERIKKSLVREVFGIDDEQHLQRYIHFHQQELIRILDMLQSKGSQKTTVPLINEPNIQFVIRALDDLLSFIESHFTRYFDQDTKAPESYIAMARSEMVVHLASFQEELRRRDAEVLLIGLVLNPLRKFIERIPTSRITYREIIYAKETTKELRRILDAPRMDTPIGEGIRSLFLYLNYNTLNYFNYYTAHLNHQVRKVDGTPQKIEQLSFLLKSIKQTQTKIGVAYNHLKQPLKEQIIDWLSEEMTHLEKSLLLSQKTLIATGTLPSDFKVQTDLSLSQLAYLIRIVVDSKMVLNKNLSDVLRFVSRACQVKSQNISYESFRVRYYNPEESIRKSVRTLLLQLVDYINKT